MFLEISQNSHENTCARVSFLIKLQALQPATLSKRRLWHRCFPVNFVKFLRTPFSQNTSGRLLLERDSLIHKVQHFHHFRFFLYSLPRYATNNFLEKLEVLATFNFETINSMFQGIFFLYLVTGSTCCRIVFRTIYITNIIQNFY